MFFHSKSQVKQTSPSLEGVTVLQYGRSTQTELVSYQDEFYKQLNCILL